jgi:TP901 family phage tail tape measure protein
MSSFLGGGANLGTAYGAIIIGTDSALRNINILGGALRASAANAMDTGRDFFTAGLIMSTAGAGMSMMFRGIIQDGMTFDTVMSGVAATLGKEAIPMMGDLREEALRIGEESAFSAQEAGSAMEELAKAGIPAEDILGGVANATVLLAEATGTEIPVAAKALSNAMNVYGLTAEEAEHGADIITSALNESSSDIHDFVAGMRTLGPVAAAMGIDMDSAAAAVASFTNFGLRGADAGVSLARGISLAARPTDDARAKMEELGITVFDTQGKFIGFGPLFDMLREKMGNLSDEAREEALAMIFGAEAADVMALAVEHGADEYERILGVTKEYGTAAAAAETRMDNLAGDVERLRGSLQTLRIQGFETINPALRTMTQFMERLVDVMIDAPPAFKAFTTVVLGAGGALASFAGAQLLFGNRLKAGLNALRTYQFALFGLRASILKITAALAILGFAWGANIFGIRDKVIGFKNTVVNAFNDIQKAFDPIMDIFDFMLGVGPTNFEFLSQDEIRRQTTDLRKLGFSANTVKQLGDFFVDIHRPLRVTERLFRNTRLGMSDFFSIISGGDASMDKFRKRMVQVFGEDAAQEIFDATFQMRRSIRKLRGEIERKFGVDLGGFFSLENVLGFVSDGFNGLVDVIQDRFLPWIGPKIATGLNGLASALMFVADHMGTVKDIIDGVTDAVGWAISRAWAPYARLLEGDVLGALGEIIQTHRELLGFIASIPLGTIAATIAGWAVSLGTGALTLGQAVAAKVEEWWPTIVQEAKQLYGYAIELTGWAITQGQVLGIAVRDKINEWWPEITSRASRVYGYAVELFDWAVNQGESLVIAVRSRVNGWWANVVSGGHRLYGYALDLFGWVVNQGESLVLAVRDRVLGWWGNVSGGVQTLYGYAIDLGGWVINQGELLLVAVRDRVLGWWANISASGHSLFGYAVNIGGWLVTQGSLLSIAVRDKVNEIWGNLSNAAHNLYDYAVSVLGFDVQDVVDSADSVKTAITNWAATQSYEILDYTVRIGSLAANRISLDTVQLAATIKQKFKDINWGTLLTEDSFNFGQNLGVGARALLDQLWGKISEIQVDQEQVGKVAGKILDAMILGLVAIPAASTGLAAAIGGFFTGLVFGEEDINMDSVADAVFKALKLAIMFNPLGAAITFRSEIAEFFGGMFAGSEIMQAIEEALFGGTDTETIGMGATATTKTAGLLTGIVDAITGFFEDFDWESAVGNNPFARIGGVIAGWIEEALSAAEEVISGRIPPWARMLAAGDVWGAIKALIAGGEVSTEPELTDEEFEDLDIDQQAQEAADEFDEDGNPIKKAFNIELIPELSNTNQIPGLFQQLVDDAIENLGVGGGRGLSPGGRAAREVRVPISVQFDDAYAKAPKLDAPESQEASFGADISDVIAAYTQAMALGRSWASQRFAARFSTDSSGVNTGGIMGALGGVSAMLDQLGNKKNMISGLITPMMQAGLSATGMSQKFADAMPLIDANLLRTSNVARGQFLTALNAASAGTTRNTGIMGSGFTSLSAIAISSSRSGSSQFRDAYGSNIQSASNRTSSLTATMRGTLQSFAGAAQTQGSNAGSNFRGGLGGGLSSALGTTQDYAGRIRGAMGSVGNGAYGIGNSAGLNLGAGLEAGLYAKLGGVSAAARALASAASSAISLAALITSPSRLWMYYGEMMGEGLRLGMLSKVDALAQAATIMSDAATPHFDSMALAALSTPLTGGLNPTTIVNNYDIDGINVDQAEDLVRWGTFVGGINQAHATVTAGA